MLDELGAAASAVVIDARVGVGQERRLGVLRTATPARAARIPSAASAISGEWAATDTGRTMARFAPSVRASSAPASIAGRSPDTTTWPGAFRFATTKMPCVEAPATSSGSPGVVEPDERGHRAVAAASGRLHQPAAFAHEADAVGERDAPAATSAEYWPIE